MEVHRNWSFLEDANLSRRAFLKRAAAASAISLSVGLLAACGDDADDDDDGDDDTGGAGEPTATTGDGGEEAATEGEEPAEETPESEEGEVKQGGTLILGYGIQQLLNLEPPRVQSGIVAGELVPNLFSSLVQFDESLSVIPDLAENWEISAEGTEFTFTLREGLTFHNGDPLVAEDLVYTYERTIDPELASPHANKLENVTSAEAVDDLTFRLTLSAPNGPFLATTCSRGPGRALTPISKRAVEEIGNEEHNLKPLGCGPFMLLPETMDPGVGFEMVAFEDWYGGRPPLDKIVVQFIPEPSSQVSALEAGDVDMLDIVPQQGVEQLRANSDIVIVDAPGTGWIGLQINLTRPPLDTLDARMAISKAINREEVVETALFGLATPGIGAIAPAFRWAYVPPDEWGENPQAFDLDAAKELAESSGLAGMELTFLAGVANTRPEEVIRAQLAEIGVDVKIDPVQNAVEEERWLAGDYDLYRSGSVVDADPDDNHYNFFITGGPWNTNGWSNEECDRILEATRASADQNERRELFHDVQRLLQEIAPMPFLYHTLDVTGFRADVMGYKAIPEMRYLESVWLDR